MSAPFIEGDPFLAPNLPLNGTPIEESIQEMASNQGPGAVWDTLLNRVLEIDGIARRTDEPYMRGATFRDNGEVMWFEETPPDISRGALVDPATGSGITLQINGDPTDERKKEDVPLYASNLSRVRIIGHHTGPSVKASFIRDQLLPIEALVTRGYDELPGPPAGTFDPLTPPRTIRVEGVTDLSVIKMMSATYRAVQQLRANR